MPNRLAGETSPYLLQHAHNPVDWYPWGDEALALARRENRPILLSIGYAACHWCHVMERESFEDPETARIMNANFVNVKVDREERPDLDAIYMRAVQALTGSGGWPMTVFLTPQGQPFYGGTYFPPTDRHGMPAFRRVLQGVADAFTHRQADVQRTIESLRTVFQESVPDAGGSDLTPALLDAAWSGMAAEFDAEHGGFRGAPKFPQVMALEFALATAARTGSRAALDVALQSFLAMARGGICDQVGGGFARYATDAQWLVPHFEKMLYDNALLVRLGVHLWQATGSVEVRRVCEQALEWVAREMTAPGGGFYSSLDADSEGVEGKFYVWTPQELDAVLGADAPLVRAWFGVTPGGNFEGRSILHQPQRLADAAAAHGVAPDALLAVVDRARAALYAAREGRVRPARDEKILASWNGLMLRAVAEAARALDDAALRRVALASGGFLFRELVNEGRVFRSYTDGVARVPGFLEDYAAVALGALALYELTFDRTWLDRARALGDMIPRLFWDEGAGVFYDTASDHERLIARPRDESDNATPSGTSLAVELSLRLGILFGDEAHTRRAERVLAGLAGAMGRYPLAFGRLLCAADLATHGAVELAIAGDPAASAFRALERAAASACVPRLVVVGGRAADNPDLPLLALHAADDDAPQAWLCRHYVCETPTGSATDLAARLPGLRPGGTS